MKCERWRRSGYLGQCVREDTTHADCAYVRGTKLKKECRRQMSNQKKKGRQREKNVATRTLSAVVI